MTLRKRSLSPRHVGFLLAVILALGSVASAEWKEKVLYSFQGGSDGSTPAGGVVFDSAGNLYGATTLGGSDKCIGPAQCGTVFQLTPPTQKGGSWTEVVLYVFQGKAVNDGSSPAGGVILDKAGNLYGTTAYGGAGNCTLLGGNVGCGTVWKLTPPKQKGGKWTESVIYSFQGGKDGDFPNGDLTFDKAGNLYGATAFGGGKGTSCNILFGGRCGTVFELRPPTQQGDKWTEKVLHCFAGIESGKEHGDGANPNGGLVLDSRGAIYGTTVWGGFLGTHCANVGCGTTFRLQPPKEKDGGSSESILYEFEEYPNDGFAPYGNLALDAKGVLFGTTGGGGNHANGVVFALSPRAGKAPWVETIAHAFEGSEGGIPTGGLIIEGSGELLGTASSYGAHFAGTVFRMQRYGAKWRLAVLYSFAGPPDAAGPSGSLAIDKAGSAYGTTQGGGTGSCQGGGCGAVFEVTP
jgi:hypothetical protein